MNAKLAKHIRSAVEASGDRAAAVQELRELLHSLSPQASQPVDLVRWVPLEMVTPNDYNPNSVAKIEMRLLYTSIHHDGYTQPCVTIWDAERHLYVIVDGFHRYYVMKVNRDIYDACGGMLPIVVIDKDINDRMASTIRHNRARGKHSVQGMSSMVFAMLEHGWEDAEICNELGMGPEELLRLKHITGFSKLFKDTEYRKAWMTERQIRIAKAYRDEHGATVQ
jgi:hypothetical protein